MHISSAAVTTTASGPRADPPATRGWRCRASSERPVANSSRVDGSCRRGRRSRSLPPSPGADREPRERRGAGRRALRAGASGQGRRGSVAATQRPVSVHAHPPRSPSIASRPRPGRPRPRRRPGPGRSRPSPAAARRRLAGRIAMLGRPRRSGRGSRSARPVSGGPRHEGTQVHQRRVAEQLSEARAAGLVEGRGGGQRGAVPRGSPAPQHPIRGSGGRRCARSGDGQRTKV